MGGTQPTNPPATETPTPTVGQEKRWTQSQATEYTAATPTPSDNLTVANPTGSYLLSQAKNGMKFFASRFGEAAISAAATKMIDRAIPTMGADNTAFLSPRDAQHIPNSWVAGLKGRPFRNADVVHTFVRLKDTDYPVDSLFAAEGIDPVMDTFSYTSPFTGNEYYSNYGMIPDNEGSYVWNRGGGVIPLYAWGVTTTKASYVDPTSENPTGKVVEGKKASHMFFKEVFDDWVASRGFDRYEQVLDGLPAAGWPGLLVCGSPWDGSNDWGFAGEETVVGMKSWCVANKYIAHKEFTGPPGEFKQQIMRYAKFYVSGNTTKQIEYPAEARPTRDTFPEPVIASDTDIPVDDADEQTVEGVEPPAQRPTTADFDALMQSAPGGAESNMETDIPVLPSQPPAEDDDDDDEEDFYDYEYIPVLRGIDMNVGDAAYYNQADDEVLPAGGQDMQDPQQSQTLFGPLKEIYGFVYGNGRAYGNTMVPGVMSLDKHYNYNGDYDYWSKMVTRTTSSSKVVGFLYSNRSTNTAPAHVYGDMVMSGTGFELRDQDNLVAFNYGRPIDDSVSSNDLANWLIQKTWNGSQPNGAAFCRAFELDMSTGEGYTNGFM
jgi:hypothetical protein